MRPSSSRRSVTTSRFDSPGWSVRDRKAENDFGLVRREPVGPTVHPGFEAADRAKVDAFYAAAAAAGGTDNGPPGIRADYGDDYYAAFVIGRDGHNIEGVTQNPESPRDGAAYAANCSRSAGRAMAEKAPARKASERKSVPKAAKCA